MKFLFRIFTILPSEQYKMCIFLIIAMLVGAILEAVGIGAILPLISAMGDTDFLSNHPQVAELATFIGINDYASFIILASVSLIGIFVLKNVYIAWENYLQISFAVKNQIYYTEDLLRVYLAKPYLFHLNNNTATLIRNVSSGAIAIFSSILIPTFYLITELMTACTIWLMLIWVDPFTAIIVAGMLSVIILGIVKVFRRKIAQQGVVKNQFSMQYLKWLNQALGAVKETKVMHKEEFFLREFGDAYYKFGMAHGKFSFLNQIPRAIIESCVVGGLLLLIILKLSLGNTPMEIVPLLGVLALAAFRLMPSANRIVNLINGIKFQMPFFDELYEDFCEIREHVNNGEVSQFSVSSNKMQFNSVLNIEHLGFCYPDSKENVLTDVSFTVPKGAFVGIVGASGAGKTTFVDLLLGILQPTRGKIMVDGKDIFSDIRAWQRNLAYVPQNIYLIDGTIKENIALGVEKKNIDNYRIELVLKMAELYDFVMELTDGIETKVGERGVKLSGGQRQRIGIARALYQQPEVLILDEATSALDNDTEKSITNTILKLKGSITILSIAHRVSTLQDCDFKVEFCEGRVKSLKNDSDYI